MARWGNCDYRQLERLQQRMERLQQADFDTFCKNTAKDLAKRLLRRVKQLTPVGVIPEYATEKAKEEYWSGYTGGTLRNSWQVGAITKTGDTYEIEIINPKEYASYVEYGHRQLPGRFVPALGKQLKNGWSKGRFMLTISEQELQVQAPAIIERKLRSYLKEVFEDDR